MIYLDVRPPKINTQGYATLLIGNTETNKFLKQKTLELKIPILDRKWDKIDLKFVSRNVKSKYKGGGPHDLSNC